MALSSDSMQQAVWDNTISKGRLQALAGRGTTYFVDSVSGLDGNGGKSWARAKKTIASAVTACAAGDTIYLKGTFSEAVTCSKAGVSFIGVGTNPNRRLDRSYGGWFLLPQALR